MTLININHSCITVQGKCLILTFMFQALSVLEKILCDAELKYMNTCTLPLKDELLHALYVALHCPTKSINKIAFSILGKMEAHNRTNFFIAPKVCI